MGADLVVCPDSAEVEVYLRRNYTEQTWFLALKPAFRKAAQKSAPPKLLLEVAASMDSDWSVSEHASTQQEVYA